MTPWKALVIIFCVGALLGYSAYVTNVSNRTDPDMEDGVRCLVEQLAQHRVGSRNADDKVAQHHGYKNDPPPAWHPPPQPTGKDYCSRFFEED